MPYDQKEWDAMVKRRQKRLEQLISSNKVKNVAMLPIKSRELACEEANEPTFTGQKTKRCAKCGIKKEYSEFPKHTESSDGFASYCKKCKNKLNVERRKKDPVARIKHYTVTRIQNEWPKDAVPKDLYTNLEHYLGYKLWQLKAALKKDLKEREGITLVQAFEAGHHLDHKVPHTSFKSKEIGDETFKQCWAISNLWLIPASVNLQKGAKMDYFDGNEDDDEDDETEETYEDEDDIDDDDAE